MGRVSVTVIFSLTLLIVTYVQSQLDFRSATFLNYDVNQKTRERSIRVLSAIAGTLTQTGRQDFVDGHLHDAIRVGWIDFYIMTYQGEPLLFRSDRPLSGPSYATLMAEHPPGKIWEFNSSAEAEPSLRGPANVDVDKIETFRFIESDLGNGVRLKMGFNTNRDAYVKILEDQYSAESEKAWLLLLVVVLGIFLFSLRDIFKIIKVTRSKGLKGLLKVKSVSKEAEILKQGFTGYRETVQKLSSFNQVLVAQVLPSLRSELQSGLTPPYDFNCTLVRTDINNFTRIFHSRPQAEFLQTINEFFVEASHVISRYQGLIHEFVGDEIIFYLKDDAHRNSFTAALACSAELADVAEKIHQRTSTQELGYDFRVKTSLAHGSLRFGPLLNGFSLAGAPLIETTRVLSQVSEKDENTIHFDSHHLPRLHKGVRHVEAFRANLKGLDGERTIIRYKGHMSLDEVLQSDSPVLIDDYRRENEILELARVMLFNSEARTASEIEVLLRNIPVTKSSANFVSGISKLLQDASVRPVSSSVHFAKYLASFIVSVPHLVPANQYQEEIGKNIERFLSHSDQRVVANTIECLESFRSLGHIQLNEKLLESNNLRVAANALTYLGKIEITNNVIKRTKALLYAKDPVKQGAGVFVWGEIVGHFMARDVAYLKTHYEFLALKDRLLELANRQPSLERLVTKAMSGLNDEKNIESTRSFEQKQDEAS